MTDRPADDSVELSKAEPALFPLILKQDKEAGVATPHRHLLEGELFVIGLDASHVVWRCGVQGLH